VAHSALIALAIAAVTPGGVTRGVITAHESHEVVVRAEAGQTIAGVLEQRESDLAITVRDPARRIVATFDGRERGPEPFAFVADMAGDYRLEVRMVAARGWPIRFAVRLARSPARDADGPRHADALALASEAKRLAALGDTASLTAALDEFTRARGLWRAAGDQPAELAMLASMARTRYRLNAFQESDADFREVLTVSRALGDVRTEVEALNNLAAVAWPTGRVSEAIDLLRLAVGLAQKHRFQYAEASARSNLGVLLWQTGELQESRRQCERALTLIRVLRDRQGEGFITTSLGMILEALAERDAARTHLLRAEALFRQAGDRLSEGRTLVRRARIELALGRVQGSLATAKRGLALTQPLADRVAEADARQQIGRARATAGDRVTARADYEAALSMYRAVGSGKGEADALHEIGLTHLADGDLALARDAFQRSLERRRTIGLRSLEAESLMALSRVERAADNLDEARAHAEAALAIFDGLRAGVFERELRTNFSRTLQEHAAAYVDVLVAMHERDTRSGMDRVAFEVAERARARELTGSLLALSSDSRAREGAPAPRAVALRRQIDALSWQIWQLADGSAGGAPIEAANARLTGLLRDAEAEEADRMLADPRRAVMLRPPVVSLPLFQHEVLDTDTVLLEYMLGERRSFVWAVARDRVTLAILPARATLERRIRPLVRALSTTGTTERARDIATLGRQLVEPVRSAIDGHERVIVVPDGALHRVPFAALAPRAGGPPLAAGHAIVESPSATMLALLKRGSSARAPSDGVAILGDPVFDPTDSRVSPPHRPSTDGAATAPVARRLSRLPHSRGEVDRIAALAGPSLAVKALDFDASRQTALGARMGRARYIHFATHAIQDDVHPDLSSIVLSLVDRSGRSQDGFLRLQDIAALRLTADLVVLSACDTASGKAVDGEGLMSLARGFFYAGASRVVATLWKVDDEASAALMGAFYESLLGRDRLAPAAALSRAQSIVRAQPRWSDPHYWAGFVLQGDW